MSDEFRQERKEENPVPPQFQGAAAESIMPQMTGNVPPQVRQLMQGKKPPQQAPQKQPDFTPDPYQGHARKQGSSQLEELIAGARQKSHIFGELKLPSKGVFYDGKDGPIDGVLHMRRMTGQEEEILATYKYVKKGQAMDMIFQRCLQEHYRIDGLLSADRAYILLWLRGESYGYQYDAEVRCPECDHKFLTSIDLNSLVINECPDDFKPPLTGELPETGYKFAFRLSRGKDETAWQAHRENQLNQFGDKGTDDTLHFRIAQLIDDIEGLKNKHELQVLLGQLPIQDSVHLRNVVTEPPFGVDMKIHMICISCYHSFQVDLPFDANFFSPRPKKTPH
jgi:hypothetical protein